MITTEQLKISQKVCTIYYDQVIEIFFPFISKDKKIISTNNNILLKCYQLELSVIFGYVKFMNIEKSFAIKPFLCLMRGDYQWRTHGRIFEVMNPPQLFLFLCKINISCNIFKKKRSKIKINFL